MIKYLPVITKSLWRAKYPEQLLYGDDGVTTWITSSTLLNSPCSKMKYKAKNTFCADEMWTSKNFELKKAFNKSVRKMIHLNK
jgi:hypothetical protein